MKFNEMENLKEYYFKHADKALVKHRYRRNDHVLEFYNEIEHTWCVSGLIFNDVSNGSFEPCEWEPKKCEKYFFPYPCKITNGLLNNWNTWNGDIRDEEIKRNVGIYQTPEEADKVARERFGWT